MLKFDTYNQNSNVVHFEWCTKNLKCVFFCIYISRYNFCFYFLQFRVYLSTKDVFIARCVYVNLLAGFIACPVQYMKGLQECSKL